MKKLSLMCVALVLAAMIGFTATKVYSEEKAFSIPVSVTYYSAYWWRGVVLPGNGYIWPGAGFEIGDLSLSVAAGISENWIGAETTADEDTAKALTELDLGASYTISTGMVDLGLGVMYVGYPYYDKDPAATSETVEASFIEASATATLKTVLSPYVAFYYDYYLNEKESKTPTSEDYYVKAGVSHDLISTEDGFSFSLGGYAGYYNNAYGDLKGWSDAVLTAGTGKDYKNMSFSSSFNYGRTLGDDFKKSNSGKKNYFWASFGATITL